MATYTEGIRKILSANAYEDINNLMRVAEHANIDAFVHNGVLWVKGIVYGSEKNGTVLEAWVRTSFTLEDFKV